MPFSESLKLEVKKKAAFRCCRCHEIGVDIHHIVPQAQDGSDDIDNAAPLCQNCHDRFGGNPEKRKEIRQMRNWWYEIVGEKYGPDSDSAKLQAINDSVLQIQKNTKDRDADISRLKLQLESLQKESLSHISPKSVGQIAGQYISATRLNKGVYANFHCGNCNHSSALLITDSPFCPTCKVPIE